MKSKAGIFCMLLGALLIIGAIVLTYWNQREDNAALESAVQIVPQLVEQIQDNTDAENVDPDIEVIPELYKPVELLTEEDKEMTEVEINGHLYIGYLSIPSLELELPIMSDWSYPKLKIAPCRYAGTLLGEDLVLMAHNYNSHFGRFTDLELDDTVIFTDVDGIVTHYQVVGQDILSPDSVEEMTAGAFDLTLFTCTYGGKSRVTIYCNKVDP
jgi:sortase A